MENVCLFFYFCKVLLYVLKIQINSYILTIIEAACYSSTYPLIRLNKNTMSITTLSQQ